MVRLTLITVGSLKEEGLRSLCAEYAKRLGAFCALRVVELKEEPIRDEGSAKLIAAALAAEGRRILEAIPPSSFRIALAVEGKMPASEELAALIGRAGDTHGAITLIIGSSYGLSDEVKAACDARISLSRLTFPHQLARLVLLEALYRSYTILSGKKYHK